MGQGTGLGLDIVRRIVRHNDGNIEVDSKPGRTEFRVTLPIADPESTVPAQ
jgi:nitrogen-specific signal transduction histidine kinase